MNLEKLFWNNDAVIVFDTETNGLDDKTHQIIELAAVRLELRSGQLVQAAELDDFVRLPEGELLPESIVELTHITDEILREQGKDRHDVADRFCRLISEGGAASSWSPTTRSSISCLSGSCSAATSSASASSFWTL